MKYWGEHVYEKAERDRNSLNDTEIAQIKKETGPESHVNNNSIYVALGYKAWSYLRDRNVCSGMCIGICLRYD